MTAVGYHAPHEQPPPSSLLTAARAAAEAGFGAAGRPRSTSRESRPGESGFAWTWVGRNYGCAAASLGARQRPGCATLVTIAQAIATPAEMYPDRSRAAPRHGEAVERASPATVAAQGSSATPG